jgi:hypothetical protein
MSSITPEKLKEFPVLVASGIVTAKGDALKFGNFAVHKGINRCDEEYVANGSGYAITHLPSGYDITYNHFHKKFTAVKFAKKFCELLGNTDIVELKKNQFSLLFQKALTLYYEMREAWQHE